MPLLSLSPLNILTHENSLLCQETSSESGLLRTFYLFTAFNNNVISNGKSYCRNDTFTDIQFTSLLARRIQIVFMLLESAFHYLFCLKF